MAPDVKTPPGVTEKPADDAVEDIPASVLEDESDWAARVRELSRADNPELAAELDELERLAKLLTPKKG